MMTIGGIMIALGVAWTALNVAAAFNNPVGGGATLGLGGLGFAAIGLVLVLFGWWGVP